MANEIDTHEVTRRTEVLRWDEHVMDQGRRVADALTVIVGSRDAMSPHEATAQIALLAAILDGTDDVEDGVKQTADNGGIMLREMPGGHGYGVYVRAAVINRTLIRERD